MRKKINNFDWCAMNGIVFHFDFLLFDITIYVRINVDVLSLQADYQFIDMR